MQFVKHGKKLFGVSVPLFSLQSDEGWCVGEYPDLARMGALCGRLGAEVLQILPVNDTGGQSSPYSALSAFALHPLYIRLDALRLAAPSETLPSGNKLAYADALGAKLKALRAVYERSAAAIQASPRMRDFIAAHPWVQTYAVYKRLKALNGDASWKTWSAHRDPQPADITALWEDPRNQTEHYFYVWMQFEADAQFKDAARALHSLGIEFMGDIPILMNDDSTDVWASRGQFDLSMKAGAPPDMYSRDGQNWGFPPYQWETMQHDDYSFWRQRIAAASAYYSAFRIDHVLGFFRLWTMNAHEEAGKLGRFIPGCIVSELELGALGFSKERIRWLSEPHIPFPHTALDADTIDALLVRIGSEDLYLFKPSIRGESDISAPGLSEKAAAWLKNEWNNRALIAVEGGYYAPAWYMQESRAWLSLSENERNALEALIASEQKKAEALWEARGRQLLTMLKESSDMLPCAEDLGAVPPCVPTVLAELGIPGLRIPRWMRDWNSDGQPELPLGEYEPLSVCAPSVHDTSTLRAYMEHEERRPCFSAEDEAALLREYASCPSMFFIPQLCDLFDISQELRSADSQADRINVPGTTNDSNWNWRMPHSIETLSRLRAWHDTVAACCGRR